MVQAIGCGIASTGSEQEVTHAPWWNAADDSRPWTVEVILATPPDFGSTIPITTHWLLNCASRHGVLPALIVKTNLPANYLVGASLIENGSTEPACCSKVGMYDRIVRILEELGAGLDLG